uniref:4Fe-4S ferredoxin-type domain-containing protein n=1 Tax=Rhinopithecus roxellana TaxID=61622 RepID=A0A2K6QFG1_RHIRO
MAGIINDFSLYCSYGHLPCVATCPYKAASVMGEMKATVGEATVGSVASNTSNVAYLQMYPPNFWWWDFWGANYPFHESTDGLVSGTNLLSSPFRCSLSS